MLITKIKRSLQKIDLKSIYQAPSEQIALKNLEEVTEKWEKVYPNSMKSWSKNWDAISPIFKFSMEVRKVVTTQLSKKYGF